MLSRLTTAFVTNLPFTDRGQLGYGDDEFIGLRMRVSTTKKVWNYQYRISDKVSSINLGHWPEVTRAEAIKRYQRARAKVSEGIDLQAERRAEKAKRRQREKVNMTLAALWQNFRAAKQRDWARGTLRSYDAKMNHPRMARLLAKKVGALTMSDGESLFAGYPEDALIAKSETARLIRQLITWHQSVYVDELGLPILQLGDIFQTAKQKSLMRQSQPRSGEYTPNVPAAIYHLIYGAYHQRTEKFRRNCDVFLLSLLTGLRIENICKMEKAWINTDDLVVTIPARAFKQRREFAPPLSHIAACIILEYLDKDWPGSFLFGHGMGQANLNNDLLPYLRSHDIAARTHKGRKAFFSALIGETNYPAPYFYALLGFIPRELKDTIATRCTTVDIEMVRGVANRIVKKLFLENFPPQVPIEDVILRDRYPNGYSKIEAHLQYKEAHGGKRRAIFDRLNALAPNFEGN